MRSEYYVTDTTADVTRTLWETALDYLRPQLNLAVIDMFPDLSERKPDVEFTEQDIASHIYLREVAIPYSSRRRRRTWMAERVDLTVPATFEAYKVFGYHSIDTAAYRPDEPPESDTYRETVAAVDNHDSGLTISVRLSEAELEGLRALLEDRCWPWDELRKWEPEPKKRRFRFLRPPRS